MNEAVFYDQFLERVISDGIKAARRDYADDPMKRDGAVAGFEACRGKSPHDLKVLLKSAAEQVEAAFVNEHSRYWYFRCFEAEVEWTCNVVSAALCNQGLEPIIHPTARGFMAAANIVGVRER